MCHQNSWESPIKTWTCHLSWFGPATSRWCNKQKLCGRRLIWNQKVLWIEKRFEFNSYDKAQTQTHQADVSMATDEHKLVKKPVGDSSSDGSDQGFDSSSLKAYAAEPFQDAIQRPPVFLGRSCLSRWPFYSLYKTVSCWNTQLKTQRCQQHSDIHMNVPLLVLVCHWEHTEVDETRRSVKRWEMVSQSWIIL